MIYSDLHIKKNCWSNPPKPTQSSSVTFPQLCEQSPQDVHTERWQSLERKGVEFCSNKNLSKNPLYKKKTDDQHSSSQKLDHGTFKKSLGSIYC